MSNQQVILVLLFFACGLAAFVNSYSKKPVNGDRVGTRLAACVFIFFASVSMFLEPAE